MSEANKDLESLACTPTPINAAKFNTNVSIPHECTSEHIKRAMNDYIDFLQFLNTQLHGKGLQRLESFLMPANFSSIVGEFMSSTIPKYCSGLVKNRYHNGHPDLIPKDKFPQNAVQHSTEGIEIKGSRHVSGWQGHNVEDIWLLVFVFDSNTSRDVLEGNPPKPFKFLKVVGAQLSEDDWTFSGRSSTSRRTITASVNRGGFEKMEANWIYRDV